MAKATVHATFTTIQQRSQEAGVEFEHMIATIKCLLICNGVPTESYVEVKQMTGSEYADKDNIEVSRPIGYKGPLDYSAFVTTANEHYKKAIGPTGRGIGFDASAKGIVMMNNTYDLGPTSVTMVCEDAPNAGW